MIIDDKFEDERTRKTITLSLLQSQAHMLESQA